MPTNVWIRRAEGPLGCWSEARGRDEGWAGIWRGHQRGDPAHRSLLFSRPSCARTATGLRIVIDRGRCEPHSKKKKIYRFGRGLSLAAVKTTRSAALLERVTRPWIGASTSEGAPSGRIVARDEPVLACVPGRRIFNRGSYRRWHRRDYRERGRRCRRELAATAAISLLGHWRGVCHGSTSTSAKLCPIRLGLLISAASSGARAFGPCNAERRRYTAISSTQSIIVELLHR